MSNNSTKIIICLVMLLIIFVIYLSNNNIKPYFDLFQESLTVRNKYVKLEDKNKLLVGSMDLSKINENDIYVSGTTLSNKYCSYINNENKDNCLTKNIIHKIKNIPHQYTDSKPEICITSQASSVYILSYFRRC